MSAAQEICSRVRWTGLCARMGVESGDGTYEALIAAHAEPHRHYHTLDHIAACLRHLDGVRDQAERPDEIEMALWFHDAVYEPFSATNEEDSAEWAADWLQEAGADRAVFCRVADLILATKAHAPATDPDTQLLLDIDLSILGATFDVYDIYEANIRREYRRVPGLIFRKKRKAILNGFMAQERIYATDHFAALWERRARENITRAIGAL